MSYIDGFVLAVPSNKKEEYQKIATESAAMLKEHDAIRVIENWGSEKFMNNPRLKQLGDMPFDGKRMIYGGFEVLLDAS
jgi:uncharacterized protein YbaA (DUF1428 family)